MIVTVMMMGLFALLGLGGNKAEATCATKPVYGEDVTNVVSVKKECSLLLKGEVEVFVEGEVAPTSKYAKIYARGNNGTLYYDSCAKMIGTPQPVTISGKGVIGYNVTYRFCGCRTRG